ncbi:MAG: type pilus assembly protein PilM [Thermoanaerobaculia bacterium]|jgi:type IV pilus assembly protein PilM|nr:type pilus assembly protein PilM [Thermoanaerobaculia bacterium]
MARSFPPDVVVIDSDSLIHCRVGRGRKELQIQQAKSYALRDDVFVPGVVTPELQNQALFAEVLRRMKMETGRWDKVSILLPDSWFRMNIIELQALPEKASEAEEVIRWSLRRTMPVDPSLLRLSYEVLSRTPPRVLAVSAIDATISAIEKLFEAAGIEVILIEPAGLNLWNAITSREATTTRDRMFFYIRDHDFTTALFRGTQPLFIRSRNLNGERTLQQEIKLSATYLRDTLQTTSIEKCYVAGNGINGEVTSAIGIEFSAPVTKVGLRDVAEQSPGDIGAYEAELAAATGVFTG